MSAITAARTSKTKRLRSIAVPLAFGANMKVWENAMACFDTATGTWKPGIGGVSTLLRAGNWAQSYDNTGGAATVQVLVDLDKEIVGTWYDNATSGAGGVIAAANLFQIAYILDNNTVSTTVGSNGVAGRAWQLSSDGKHVLVVADSASFSL